MTRILLVPVVLLIAACSDQPDTPEPAPTPSEMGWSAITEQQWPPRNEAPATEADLDINPGRVNIAVVLDMSGSMAESRCAGEHRDKAAAARVAMGRWIESVPDDANLGLVTFDAAGVEVAVSPGTGNREAFRRAVGTTRPGGGTPLRSSLQEAHELLAAQGRRQLGYGRYQLIVVTDGAHSSGEDPAPIIETIVTNPANPVELHTIGFCIDDSALRRPGWVNYQSANNPAELAQGLSRVLAESTAFEPLEDFHEN
ncbi:vWA domain-containing protein [Spiribacter vilamensis]|uniref:von Willebrand factor type A domain-containing protein n=1 Tax=Spiribacter vilamensis TaxID=531306 RepID=A0A4Q8CYQ7_9GAMM|nr:vWA domain-containing protein [Spiribacter vilamensis]RZU98136.1 von Willebrand factor type A domain-containing protein [Spiribacter vilamensis]TVO60963.1 VWA domain-containing protein [Spiribacter vilamensis]